MDAGIMTTIVAGIFGALGIIIGFTIGKISSRPQKDFTPVLREFEAVVKSLHNKVSRLTEVISSSTEEILNEQKSKIEDIIGEIEKLKRNIEDSGLSIKSAEVLESILEELRGLSSKELPSATVDEQFMTRLKDKIDIIRAEIESIKISSVKSQKEVESPSIDVEKLEDALNMAREINEEAVKGDLISLMYAFKDDDKKDLLKSIDEMALNSKQLVLILEDLIKSVKERETK